MFKARMTFYPHCDGCKKGSLYAVSMPVSISATGTVTANVGGADLKQLKERGAWEIVSTFNYQKKLLCGACAEKHKERE